MFEKELSERLREIRKLKRLTQQDIADYLHVNRSTYTYYETGKTQPSVQTIYKLAKLYKVSTDLLISGKKRAKRRR